MKIETDEIEGGVVRVRLVGRMDIAGVDAIAVPFSALAAADDRRVIVDSRASTSSPRSASAPSSRTPTR
jgi:hypothetical protein